jgi:hypothetical protein
VDQSLAINPNTLNIRLYPNTPKLNSLNPSASKINPNFAPPFSRVFGDTGAAMSYPVLSVQGENGGKNSRNHAKAQKTAFGAKFEAPPDRSIMTAAAR